MKYFLNYKCSNLQRPVGMYSNTTTVGKELLTFKLYYNSGFNNKLVTCICLDINRNKYITYIYIYHNVKFK